MVPVQDFFNFSTFIVPSVSSALILQWHSRGTKSETWQNHRLCPKYPKLKLQLLQVHMISVFMPFSQVQQCFNVTVKTDDHESPQLLKQKYGLYILKLQAKRSSTLPLLGSCICFDTPLGSQFTFTTHTNKKQQPSKHQLISGGKCRQTDSPKNQPAATGMWEFQSFKAFLQGILQHTLRAHPNQSP